MASAHRHISMIACVLLCACSSSTTQVKRESHMGPNEGQPPVPIARIINLDEKSELNPDGCSEKEVGPGDTVSWTSTRINDIRKVEVRFFGFESEEATDSAVTPKHPFEEEPRLSGNRVSRDAPRGRYSYRVTEGATALGCGVVTNPVGPPNQPQGGGHSGTQKTSGSETREM